MRSLLVGSAMALALSACGPRTNHLSSTWGTPVGAAKAGEPAAPPQAENAAEEPPTGDPGLKAGGAALGKEPPELKVDDWIGAKDPPSLDKLYGRPILVEFCQRNDAACDEARGVLRELHDEYGSKGLALLEIFVDQPSGRTPDWEHWSAMKKDLTAMALPWPAGYGESTTYTRLRYGFASVPAAYLVDADGKLVWSGNPKKYAKSLAAAVDTIVARAP